MHLANALREAEYRSMNEDGVTHRLGEVLNHLHAIAATFSTVDHVNEVSAPTADDLNATLNLAEKMHARAK